MYNQEFYNGSYCPYCGRANFYCPHCGAGPFSTREEMRKHIFDNHIEEVETLVSQFCLKPCPSCFGVCTLKKGHSGNHVCSQGHIW